MATVLDPPATATGRKRWTREDCAFLENAGLLVGRYELLDGEIIVKRGQNYPHSQAVTLAIAYALHLAGAERVRTQTTREVREGDRVTNRPEPDVVVLRTPVRRIPFGTDVSLAIEGSDTTQADDFGAKVGLYARAGVAEYWVLDLPRRRLVAFRRLEDDVYAVRAEFTESDTLAAEMAPSLPVRLADLLPPAE